MPRVPTGAGSSRRRWLERALFALGAVLLGYVIWSRLDAAAFNAHQKARLERMTAGTAPAAADTASPPPDPGDLLGRIDIPRVGVSAVILEGTDAHTLGKAVGHIPGTALPGGRGRGNVALAGHRDTFFRGLHAVRAGDTVTVATPRSLTAYTVDSTWVVRPEEIGVLDPTPTPELTLVTCYPFHYVGPAPKRYVVRAHRLRAAGASPPTRPGS